MFPGKLQRLNHFKNFLPLFGVWAHRDELTLDLLKLPLGFFGSIRKYLRI